MATAEDIINACKNRWTANKADCSAFVRAVANDFGVVLTGDANSITLQIQQVGWTVLDSGADAKAKAETGMFVVGALAGGDNLPPDAHGHVVIVVAGDLAQGQYPTAYWGRLGSVGEQNKTTNYAWNAGSRDKVVYSSRQL